MIKLTNGSIQFALMMVISVITQIIVLGRSATVAGVFGISEHIDAYNAVHSVANFLFSFISSGITTVLIPAFVQKKKITSINTFISLLYTFGIAAIAISYIFRMSILSSFSSGRDSFVMIGMQFFLVTMFSQFFNTQIGVSSAFFQVKNKYNIPKVCTLIANAILLVLIITDKQITVYNYAVYVAIITIGNAVTQMCISRFYGYKYRPLLRIDSEVKTMIIVFIPTVFSAGLYQINLLTDTYISSRLGPGQITILSYSNQIVTLINGLLITNILIFLYPKIVASFDKDVKEQQEQLFSYIYFAEAIMALLLVGFIAVGKDVIGILYEHGKFSSENSRLVYLCICLYMIGLPINMARDLLYRFFYAKGNTSATFKNSVIVSALNFTISILLSIQIGIYGVIAGTVISSLISMIMIFVRLVRNYGFYYSKKTLSVENLKIMACSAFTISVIIYLKSIVSLNAYLSILLFGTLSVLIFIISLFMTGSKAIKVRF